MEKIKLGKYQHYKGTIAEVIGVARHSETLEEFVVYKHPNKETGEMEFWIRPLKMFLEEVEFNGKKVSRFKYVEP